MVEVTLAQQSPAASLGSWDSTAQVLKAKTRFDDEQLRVLADADLPHNYRHYHNKLSRLVKEENHLALEHYTNLLIVYLGTILNRGSPFPDWCRDEFASIEKAGNYDELKKFFGNLLAKLDNKTALSEEERAKTFQLAISVNSSLKTVDQKDTAIKTLIHQELTDHLQNFKENFKLDYDANTPWYIRLYNAVYSLFNGDIAKERKKAEQGIAAGIARTIYQLNNTTDDKNTQLYCTVPVLSLIADSALANFVSDHFSAHLKKKAANLIYKLLALKSTDELLAHEVTYRNQFIIYAFVFLDKPLENKAFKLLLDKIDQDQIDKLKQKCETIKLEAAKRSTFQEVLDANPFAKEGEITSSHDNIAKFSAFDEDDSFSSDEEESDDDSEASTRVIPLPDDLDPPVNQPANSVDSQAFQQASREIPLRKKGKRTKLTGQLTSESYNFVTKVNGVKRTLRVLPNVQGFLDALKLTSRKDFVILLNQFALHGIVPRAYANSNALTLTQPQQSEYTTGHFAIIKERNDLKNTTVAQQKMTYSFLTDRINAIFTTAKSVANGGSIDTGRDDAYTAIDITTSAFSTLPVVGFLGNIIQAFNNGVRKIDSELLKARYKNIGDFESDNRGLLKVVFQKAARELSCILGPYLAELPESDPDPAVPDVQKVKNLFSAIFLNQIIHNESLVDEIKVAVKLNEPQRSAKVEQLVCKILEPILNKETLEDAVIVTYSRHDRARQIYANEGVTPETAKFCIFVPEGDRTLDNGQIKYGSRKNFYSYLSEKILPFCRKKHKLVQEKIDIASMMQKKSKDCSLLVPEIISFSEEIKVVNEELDDINQGMIATQTVSNAAMRASSIANARVSQTVKEVAQTKSEVAQTKSEVAQTKSEVAQTKSEVAQTRTSVAHTQEEVRELKKKVLLLERYGSEESKTLNTTYLLAQFESFLGKLIRYSQKDDLKSKVITLIQSASSTTFKGSHFADYLQSVLDSAAIFGEEQVIEDVNSIYQELRPIAEMLTSIAEHEAVKEATQAILFLSLLKRVERCAKKNQESAIRLVRTAHDKNRFIARENFKYHLQSIIESADDDIEEGIIEVSATYKLIEPIKDALIAKAIRAVNKLSPSNESQQTAVNIHATALSPPQAAHTASVETYAHSLQNMVVSQLPGHDVKAQEESSHHRTTETPVNCPK